MLADSGPAEAPAHPRTCPARSLDRACVSRLLFSVPMYTVVSRRLASSAGLPSSSPSPYWPMLQGGRRGVRGGMPVVRVS